jgi:hypothetical protein
MLLECRILCNEKDLIFFQNKDFQIIPDVLNKLFIHLSIWISISEIFATDIPFADGYKVLSAEL